MADLWSKEQLADIARMEKGLIDALRAPGLDAEILRLKQALLEEIHANEKAWDEVRRLNARIVELEASHGGS